MPRRAFRLPPEDEEFLDGLGLTWETIIESVPNGQQRWLLIHDHPIPEGYTQRHALMALMIEPLYPDVQIDMAYFSPGLHRQDGQRINGLSDQPIEGMVFQCWSRHRTAENPWRPSVDDVSTHLAVVWDWLTREFTLRPTP